MLEKITFKTELNEIITPEEVSILFDNISIKYAPSLVSISLYPFFIELKNEIIEKAKKQRNKELSKLLTEIANRKQVIKINMWSTLNEINLTKKELKNSEELEQITYEEEQIINAYEESIKALTDKEKKVMSGIYPRINKITSLPKTKSLKKQLELLKEELLSISKQHDDCFIELEEKLEDLIKLSIITSKHIVPVKNMISEEFNVDTNIEKGKIFENIEYIYSSDLEDDYSEDSIYKKDIYIYEPNKTDFEDDLIYQLLNNEKYEDGTINALLITTEYDYDEI